MLRVWIILRILPLASFSVWKLSILLGKIANWPQKNFENQLYLTFQVWRSCDNRRMSGCYYCHVVPVYCWGHHSGGFKTLNFFSYTLLYACMAGIVFAKFTKPTNRAETILFSKNALISLPNGSYFLLLL